MRKTMLVSLILAAVLAGCADQKPVRPELVPIAKDVATNLTRGDFDAVEATFDDTMKTMLPAAELAKTWAKVEDQAGAFKSMGDTQTALEAGYEVVYVTCVFENGSIKVKVVFDDANRVAGLFIKNA